MPFTRAVKYTYSTKIATRNAGERKASVLGMKVLQEYYKENVKQLGSKIAKNRTEKVTSYCPDCIDEPHLCLKCFNTVHR